MKLVVAAMVGLVSASIVTACGQSLRGITEAQRATTGQESESGTGPSFVSGIRLPDGENHATVPLLRGGESLYVQVNINGRDAGVFSLDTGSTVTLIDRRNAEILRLPVMQRREITLAGFHDTKTYETRVLRIDSMTVGPIQVDTRRMVDIDLTASSRRIGKHIGGIIGMDILSRMPVTLDLAGGTMTFHAPDAFNEPAGDPGFDLVMRDGKGPHVWGQIGGRFDALLLIDTGDEHLLHLHPDFVQRHPEALTGPVIRMTSAVGMSGTPVELEERFGTLNVFGQTFDHVLMSSRPTRLVGDGALGALLGRFRITFDVAGRRMWARYQPPKSIAQRLAEGLNVNGEDLIGRTPLFAATDKGDVVAVNALIEAGADVNAVDNRDRHPLVWAATWGELQVVRVLVEAGAAVNLEDPDGYTPLTRAAGRGHLPVVEALLAAGADVNRFSGEGFPPLSPAAGKGHHRIVELLLSKGARVTARGGALGGTALHFAASSGHVNVMKKLLAAGADVRAEDTEGGTPLHQAAASGSREAVELLLVHGADVHARIRTGVLVKLGDQVSGKTIEELARAAVNETDERTPVMGTALMSAAMRGHLEVAERLLEAGADINAVDARGASILMLAAMGGGNDVARMLLAAGADLDARTDDGSTALFFAAARLDEKIVRLMIDMGAGAAVVNQSGQTPLMAACLFGRRDGVIVDLSRAGADVNQQTVKGNTALALAAITGDRGAVEQLIDVGADVNAVVEKGKTALMLSALSGSRPAAELVADAAVPSWTDASADIVRLLLEHGAELDITDEDGVTALGLAAGTGRVDVVAALIDAGADVNAGGELGRTPLSYAAGNARLEVVRLLLDRGAEVNPGPQESADPSPLMAAAFRGDTAIVDLLLEKGAKPQATNDVGGTALHGAALAGRLESVRALLAAGAKVDAATDSGATPLMVAVGSQDDQVVQALIDAGADVNASNEDGFTCLSIARSKRDDLIHGMLELAGARY